MSFHLHQCPPWRWEAVGLQAEVGATFLLFFLGRLGPQQFAGVLCCFGGRRDVGGAGEEAVVSTGAMWERVPKPRAFCSLCEELNATTKKTQRNNK